jgi:hypothetical protein
LIHRLAGSHSRVGQPLGRATRGVRPGERPSPVLALGRAMVAALDSDRLPERDDRPGVAVLALAIDALIVVAHVERGRLGGKAARLRRVEQRGDVVGLVATGRLDLPRDRKVCAGADRRLDTVAVEAAALARRDCRTVPPARVRVGKALP